MRYLTYGDDAPSGNFAQSAVPEAAADARQFSETRRLPDSDLYAEENRIAIAGGINRSTRENSASEQSRSWIVVGRPVPQLISISDKRARTRSIATWACRGEGKSAGSICSAFSVSPSFHCQNSAHWNRGRASPPSVCSQSEDERIRLWKQSVGRPASSTGPGNARDRARRW